MISPTGVQAVHPDGEVAVARAAAARGMAMGLSSFASKPIEDVIAANPQTFFQIYWSGDRDPIASALERARPAGAVGLILTLDWSFSHGRDWGSPFDPDRHRPQDGASATPPRRSRRPRWLLALGPHRSLPDLTVPNMAVARRARAHVLRRLRRVDADAAADVGRRRLAAGAVGRPVHGQGHHAASTTPAAPSTPASRPSRCPTTAATTSTARRPRSARCPRSPTRSATSRGRARRRHPPRQRRGQGAWPSAPGR